MGHDELLTGVRITGLLVTTKQLAGFLLVPSGLAASGNRSVILDIRLEVEESVRARSLS